jgi:hypothetical protein
LRGRPIHRGRLHSTFNVVTHLSRRSGSFTSESLALGHNSLILLTQLLLLLLSPGMLDTLYLILTRLMLCMRSLKILKEIMFGFWCHLLLTAIPSVPNGFSKNKQSEDGLVVRNKARLVAQGYCQKRELIMRRLLLLLPVSRPL